MKKQFPDVPAKHGAPMGRRSVGEPGDKPLKVFKVEMVDGDYDDGGAYWGGGGDPVWCLRGEGLDGEPCERFTRARTRDEAVSVWTNNFPGLKVVGPDWDEQVDTVTRHYIIAAIWADCEEGTYPTCSPEEELKARQACEAFMLQCEAAGGLFSQAVARFAHGYGAHPDSGSAEAAFGHDFWLTRQGHGTGFWDRKELGKELGALLTAEAKKVGESYPYQEGDKFYLTDR